MIIKKQLTAIEKSTFHLKKFKNDLLIDDEFQSKKTNNNSSLLISHFIISTSFVKFLKTNFHSSFVN